MIGILLIFITNLHHQMLLGIVGSYGVLVPGAAFPLGDVTDVAARLVARSFAIAMQISAPYIVVGIVFQVGLGLIARLMPQVQALFISVPLQILLSFILMAVSISAGFLWFLDNFSDQLAGPSGRG